MIKTVKARFSKGVIKPLEKVEFPEGRELKIVILEPERDILDATFGSWADLVDCEELKKNIYADRQISTRQEVKL